MTREELKTFYVHWQDKDEIDSFRVMCVGVDSYPVVVSHRENTSTELRFDTYTDYYNCKLVLSREESGLGNLYWIVAIRDNEEIARWNTAFVLDLLWAATE